MALTMNTNLSAMAAQRNLTMSSNRAASSLNKLSSGSRVPSAKDDAAALGIGMGLRADSSALRAAQVNTQQASSVLQIADGAFGQIADILTRMKSLATTSQSGQLSNTQRGFLDTEFTGLKNEIDRISATTSFNGVNLLGSSSTIKLDAFGAATGTTEIDFATGFVGYTFDSSKVTTGDTFSVSYKDSTDTMTITNVTKQKSQSVSVTAAPGAGQTASYDFDTIGVKVTLGDQFAVATDINAPMDTTDVNANFTVVTGTAATAAATLAFQVGTKATANDKISVTFAKGDYITLTGAAAPAGIASSAAAVTASAEIDTAVAAVNSARATLGANLSRIDFAGSNLAVSIENVEGARSALMDVDVSAEMTNFTSQQVLAQAGVSMLAQANQQPSMLLKLLQ